jgi:hypothetical protein
MELLRNIKLNAMTVMNGHTKEKYGKVIMAYK